MFVFRAFTWGASVKNGSFWVLSKAARRVTFVGRPIFDHLTPAENSTPAEQRNLTGFSQNEPPSGFSQSKVKRAPTILKTKTVGLEFQKVTFKEAFPFRCFSNLPCPPPLPLVSYLPHPEGVSPPPPTSLPGCLAACGISSQGPVSKFDPGAVVYENGTSVKADLVILATGYRALD